MDEGKYAKRGVENEQLYYLVLCINSKASLYPKHIYFNDLKYFGWQLIIIVQEVQFTNEYKPQNNARILLNHEVWYL